MPSYPGIAFHSMHPGSGVSPSLRNHNPPQLRLNAHGPTSRAYLIQRLTSLVVWKRSFASMKCVELKCLPTA